MKDYILKHAKINASDKHISIKSFDLIVELAERNNDAYIDDPKICQNARKRLYDLNVDDSLVNKYFFEFYDLIKQYNFLRKDDGLSENDKNFFKVNGLTDSDKKIIKAADKDPASQYIIGIWYRDGAHLSLKNQAESLVWFNKSADGNDSDSQYELGYYYYPSNKEKAIEYLKKSIDQDNSNARNKMGEIYLDENYDGHDYSKAYDLFIVAAKDGNSNACSNLAEMFTEGLGVVKDSIESEKWQKQSFNLRGLKY